MDGNGIIEPWEFSNKTRLVGGRYKTTPLSFTVLKVTGGTVSNVRIDGVSVEEGLYLGGGNPGGVNISGTCTFANSVVRNCRVYNAAGDVNSTASGGIATSVTNAVIDGCLIENCEAQPCQSTAAYAGQAKGGGVWSAGTIQNSVVRNNRVLYNNIQPAGNTNTVKYNPYLYAAGIYLYNKTAKAINCVVNNNEVRVINWDMTNHSGDLNSIVVRGAGINAENGGSIINCTVVNNAASVKDLNGNFVLTAASAGQGVGIYQKSQNSASTNNEGYLVNTVAWGNYAPGVSASSQQIYLSTATAAAAATPLFDYYNNVTPASVSGFVSPNTAFFVASGQLTNLSATNGTAGTGPLFLYPSTFAGAVWGTVAQASADSLKSITKANWTIQSGSYLSGKGTISYTAAGSISLLTPTLDLIGISRSANAPSVGAFESQNWTSPTGLTGLWDSGRKVYRSENELFNLTIGDRITVFDACGRKLQVLNASTNQLQLSSNGFVIISVQHPNGEIENIK